MTMLHFAQLLRTAPSGLYQLVGDWRSPRIDKLCRLRGVGLFRIDCSQTRDKRRFLAVAARELGCPDWFGCNWDALADCVTDLEWAPAFAYAVVLGDIEGFATRAPEQFDTALEIFEQAARFWSGQGIPFHVLVAAPAPGGALPAIRAP